MWASSEYSQAGQNIGHVTRYTATAVKIIVHMLSGSLLSTRTVLRSCECLALFTCERDVHYQCRQNLDYPKRHDMSLF